MVAAVAVVGDVRVNPGRSPSRGAGAGESGKSTIFKQIRYLHGAGFLEEERRGQIPSIHSNTIAAMKTLVEMAANFGIHLTATVRPSAPAHRGATEFGARSACWEGVGGRPRPRRCREGVRTEVGDTGCDGPRGSSPAQPRAVAGSLVVGSFPSRASAGGCGGDSGRG